MLKRIGLALLCCCAWAPAWGKTILWREHVFTFADGVGLPLSLIQGRDEAFYGTSAHPYGGALFRYSSMDGVTRILLASVGGQPSRVIWWGRWSKDWTAAFTG